MREPAAVLRHARARGGALRVGRRSRRGAVLAAGLLAGGVLAGCGQGGGIQEAAAPDPAVDPAAATSAPAVDLAEGLLPASAFAPGATVLPLTEELLRSSGLPAGGVPPGTELDLGDCAALLTQLQAAAAAGVDAAAGQAVLEGAQATVQGLVAGSAAGDAVATVTGALEGCRTASASVPEHGAATVTVGEVRRPDLGDAAVEVAATVDATAPDGRQVTAPVLVAFVQDGDRVMSLATTVLEGGALDEQAFAGRLAEAYRVQDEALG